MTREEAFLEINQIQDYYVDKLLGMLNDPSYDSMKMINFTSPTGTGKTKMMSKLINRLPDCYFIITTLSKGQLHLQIKEALNADCENANFDVYGSADYKINSRLEAEDIICKIPDDTKCIWLRDEGHIKTNRFDELLIDVCYRIVNFSATNDRSEILCNFATTMMLRTVNQTSGTPEDAIRRLMEIKDLHKGIKDYNPCAIFRCVSGNDRLYDTIIDLCKKYNLRYIDITDDPFVMAKLCEDSNENDVIINKFKLVEGIDIRRAHVLYMDNKPENNATTIQIIGRCRRNALLYRNDIDILAPENRDLLKITRECYVYYNVEHMKIDTDETGELQYAFCNHVSCEALKEGSVVYVENGQLSNGLYVIELEGKTGKFRIIKDEETGYNIVDPITGFYDTEVVRFDDNYICCYGKKIHFDNIRLLPIKETEKRFDFTTRKYVDYDVEPYYDLTLAYGREEFSNYKCNVSKEIVKAFKNEMRMYTKERIRSAFQDKCLDVMLRKVKPIDIGKIEKEVKEFIEENSEKKGLKLFCRLTDGLNDYSVGDYLLQDICSNDEMILLKNHLIKLKDAGKSNDDIEIYIINYVKMKKSYINRTHNSDDIIQFKHGFEKVAHVLFENGTIRLFSRFKGAFLTEYTTCLNLNELTITRKNVYDYFDQIESTLNKENNGKWLFVSLDDLVDSFLISIDNTYENLNKSLVDRVRVTYSPLFEELNQDESYIELHLGSLRKITVKEYESLSRHAAYDKIVNDRESAIIGVDLMRQIKNKDNQVKWTEASTVTSKIDGFNKLNTFITQRYKEELKQARNQCFTGKNSFKLNKKCNSVLGYCVEYYSKYLIYGETYLGIYLKEALSESDLEEVNDCIVIRACMLKYKEMMIRSFGEGVAKVIKGISIQKLIEDDYSYFVELVVDLGYKTANYVHKVMYPGENVPKNDVDPNLSIRHISGLADYITKDTILDVKVRNYIDEKSVRQVLAYHYLSTKRSDLDIRRVIVYDAVSNRSVIINIGEKCEIQDFSDDDPTEKGVPVEDLYRRVKKVKKKRKEEIVGNSDQITINMPEESRDEVNQEECFRFDCPVYKYCKNVKNRNGMCIMRT